MIKHTTPSLTTRFLRGIITSGASLLGASDRYEVTLKLIDEGLTAVHEAGHVIVGDAYGRTTNQVIVRNIGGGVAIPEEFPRLWSLPEDQILSHVSECYAGIAAEEAVFGRHKHLMHGAKSDMDSARSYAELAVLKRHNPQIDALPNNYLAYKKIIFPELSTDAFAREVEQVLTEAEREARMIIENNKERLLQLASELQDKKRLGKAQIAGALNLTPEVAG